MAKTLFHPHTHGFAFVNAWKFSSEEDQQMKQTLVHAAKAAPDTSGTPLTLVARRLRPALRSWTKGAVPEYYGLCGGMACAALDYYLLQTPLPRGGGYHDLPTNDTPEGAALRGYLLRRQLESMALNFPKLLFWMAVLHVDLPFIEGDGPRWLLQRSREEWDELKGRIDSGTPWPLMLIGSSASPFNNHQVLAYGYEEPAEGTGTLYVYDMNCPDTETTISLDFRQPVLMAQETCADARRGPLRGFFCNVYQRSDPPTMLPTSHTR